MILGMSLVLLLAVLLPQHNHFNRCGFSWLCGYVVLRKLYGGKTLQTSYLFIDIFTKLHKTKSVQMYRYSLVHISFSTHDLF